MACHALVLKNGRLLSGIRCEEISIIRNNPNNPNPTPFGSPGPPIINGTRKLTNPLAKVPQGSSQLGPVDGAVLVKRTEFTNI